MRFTALKKVGLLLGLFSLLVVAGGKAYAATPAPALPNPVLVFVGTEPFQANGKQFIRYNYEVFNFADYPNELFAASPNLPPCGKNTKAARTWLDFYDQSGKRLYGFCALGSN